MNKTNKIMTEFRVTTPQLHHSEVKGVIGHYLPEVELPLDLSLIERVVVDYISPFHHELENVSDDATLRTLLTQCESVSSKGSVTDQSYNSQYVDQSGRNVLYAAVQSHKSQLVKTLVNSGVSLNSKTKSGYTALHAASSGNNTELVQWLTSKGAYVNAASKDGTTPLHFAAYNGNSVMVENLLQKGADVDVQDDKGRTPLMAACQQGYLTTAETLIRLKANVKKQDKSGRTALFYAVMKGQMDLVQCLLRKNKLLLGIADNNGNTVFRGCVTRGNFQMVKFLQNLGAVVDTQSRDGTSALMAATQEGHEDIVEFLIDAGASVSCRDNLGNTSLMYAVHSAHCELVEKLVSFKGLVNMTNHRGNTPLIVAATGGDLNIVSVLLKNGAQIDAKNNAGITALMAASAEGHEGVVKFLAGSGASLTVKSQNGLTPLHIAEAKKHNAVMALLNSRLQDSTSLSEDEEGACMLLAIEVGNLPMVRKLMQKNVNVNWRDDQGVTLLMQACLKNELEAVKILLRNNANVHHENVNGVTALCYAVQGKNLHIVDWLLSCGLSLNARDVNGYTLLHNAAARGQVEIVEFLERLGAELDVSDHFGKTPLMLACENGFIDVVTYLVNSGADIEIFASGSDACEFAFVAGHDDIVSFLKSKMSHSIPEFDGTVKALFVACKQGNMSKVLHLLQQSPKLLYCRDPKNKGMTLMHIAAQKGHKDVVNVLYKKGVNVNIRSFSGDTAIRQASFHGNLSVVKLLVSFHANVNLADHEGRTPLMCASQEGYVDIVQVLIQSGCLLSLTDKALSTALSFSLRKNNIDVAQILLENHANPDVKDGVGHTSLAKQCLKGNLTVVELLTMHGANVNNLDYHGRTPLMAAARIGTLAVVKHLVNKGANAHIKAHQNENAKQYAMTEGHYDVVKYLEEVESNTVDTSTLKTKNGDTNIKGHPVENYKLGASPGEKIIEINTLQDALHNSGSSANSGSKENLNEELKLAVMARNSDMVQELIQKGASVNYQSTDGCTPLMYAVQQTDIPTIKKLLKSKASIELLDKKGNDVFQYASDNADVTSTLINFLTCSEDEGEKSRFSTKEVRPCETDDKNENIEAQIIAYLMAVQMGDVQSVKDLLEVGYVTHLTDSDLQNAVFRCSLNYTESSVEILNMLHRSSVDLNCTDVHGTTPLLNSVLMGNQCVALCLIDLGADLNKVNHYGQSVLMECCFQDNAKLIDSLLQRGQDLSDSSLLSALVFALVNHLEQLLEVFEKRLSNLDIVWHCDVSMIYKLVVCNPVIIETALSRTKLESHQQKNDLLLAQILEEGLMTLDNQELRPLLRNLTSMICRDNDTRPCLLVILDTDAVSTQFDDEKTLMEDSSAEGKAEMTDVEQKELNEVYRLFSSVVLKHAPSYIKGFSKDTSLAKIYVYTVEGGKSDAETFVREELPANRVVFEFVTLRSEAQFLMGDHLPQPARSSATNLVQGGSLLAQVTMDGVPEISQRMSAGGSVDAVKKITPCGSLTCFMTDPEGQTWGLTSGHTFQAVDEKNLEKQNKWIVSQACGDQKMCFLANSSLSAMTLAKIDGVTKFIDITVFPLTQKCQENKDYSLQIPHLKLSPKLFEESNSTLLSKKIVKIGAVTGTTTGQIVDIDHTTTLGNCLCPGMFVIIPNEELPFAASGDSGAPVFDLDTDHVIGLVCGSSEKYFIQGQWHSTVVFGIRLDNCIEYVAKTYNLILHFKEHVGEKITQCNEESNNHKPNDELVTLQRRCKELELENQNLNQRLAEAERKLKQTEQEKMTKARHIPTTGDISIDSCNAGDLVVLIWEEYYQNYLLLTGQSNVLHFLHTDCLEPLGLNSGQSRPNKMLAEIVTKERYQATKANNRFKVPVDTEFYQVRCKKSTHGILQSRPVPQATQSNRVQIDPELLSLIENLPH